MNPRFFNTLTRKESEFEPLEAGQVRMYTCGPTVYNHAHIGNFRAYLFEDLLQRHLEFRGFKVDRVMNLTDVDDKTIRGCQAAGVPLAEFTAPFKKAFFEDLETLRVRRAGHFPEATDPVHIARMIKMIENLLAGGHAYQAEDGSVYFRISSFASYGRLAHYNLDELRPSGRVDSDEYEKEQIADFALWKAWTEVDGEVGWDSPWGKGRPGWHIECSAMALGLLGDQIDIHCGGEDNIFPHHEAEIAQCECVTGQPFVRLWMHCKHLLVDGKKMAKSEGNFFTVRDLQAKGWTGREVRYALLAVKYREPLNFTFEGLEAARKALGRIDAWWRRIEEHVGGVAAPLPTGLFPEQFGQALDDDLNISGALAGLFDLIRESNRLFDRGDITPGQARTLQAWRDRIDSVLAFAPDAEGVPADVQALVDRRQVARREKDWTLSDSLRDEIAAAGWQVKDTKEGQKVTRG